MKIDDQSKAKRGDEPAKEKADATTSKGKKFEDVLKSPRRANKGDRRNSTKAGRREVMDRLDDRCGNRRRREHRESGRLERRCHERSVEDGHESGRRHEARATRLTRAAGDREWKRGDAPTRPNSGSRRSELRRRPSRGGEEGMPLAGEVATGAKRVRPATAETSRAKGTSRASADVETVRRLASEVAKSVKVGLDRAKRQVVLMDVEIPGRGTVHVRLRRQGARFDARLRADDHRLARMLRRHRGDLRQAGEDAGVSFGELRVADPN